MMKLVLLLLLCHVSSSVKHSLKFYITTSSGVPNLPEFMIVGEVDDIQVAYCDGSNKIYEPRQDWMKKVLDENPHVWTLGTNDCFQIYPPLFKSRLNTFIQLSNHSEGSGVHILQTMIGCELEEKTGEVTGFVRYGYNGEDFIELDLKMLTWTALRPEADIIKQEWNEDTLMIKEYEEFLTQMCPELLKLGLMYGNSSLLRTDVPSVSLLQKTPSSPVSCHATGFYPDRAMMFWRKDGEEIHEGVEHGEILPNHDGSFQMNVDLDISSVSPEDWRRYDCVFHLSGVEDDIITKLDETQIRTNWVKPSNKTTTIIIISAVVVVVVVFAAAAGFMVHKKKQDQKAPPDSEEALNSLRDWIQEPDGVDS
ncbi:major histocompatibility complex class I-related gene protein-like [Mugil cephalus]|uniref:major histocompatibility complex class I-related gene protein-like n=1 Tax=Mugil cephalus TaxID=48193 RepID=UPI001FB66029|nr:major histocompatibility complex class I-related gene protein-like [Mugil cephalus]